MNDRYLVVRSLATGERSIIKHGSIDYIHINPEKNCLSIITSTGRFLCKIDSEMMSLKSNGLEDWYTGSECTEHNIACNEVIYK